MSYEDTAPNLSKLLDVDAFRAMFPAPPPPGPPVGEPNAARKAALLQAFATEYTAHGGAVNLARLAQSQGVPLRWCKLLRDEVNATKAEQYAEEPV